MTGLIAFSLIVLALTLALGLIGVFRGPSIQERIISAQLVGTTGVAVLLLLGFILEMPASIDVALVLALLTAVATAALTRGTISSEPQHD